jgi:hypothetical protein
MAKVKRKKDGKVYSMPDAMFNKAKKLGISPAPIRGRVVEKIIKKEDDFEIILDDAPAAPKKTKK